MMAHFSEGWICHTKQTCFDDIKEENFWNIYAALYIVCQWDNYMEKGTYEQDSSISEPHDAMDVWEETNSQVTNP